MDSKVVFPEPAGPMTHRNSPARTARSTPRRAATSASPWSKRMHRCAVRMTNAFSAGGFTAPVQVRSGVTVARARRTCPAPSQTSRTLRPAIDRAFPLYAYGSVGTMAACDYVRPRSSARVIGRLRLRRDVTVRLARRNRPLIVGLHCPPARQGQEERAPSTRHVLEPETPSVGESDFVADCQTVNLMAFSMRFVRAR